MKSITSTQSGTATPQDYSTTDSSLELGQTYTTSYTTTDPVIAQLTEIEERLAKIELALTHVIPHILEKLATE